MIQCLVVDDEPIARAGILEHIEQTDFLHPVAECRSALEAADWMRRGHIDLLFLDIQMPQLTGIDFIKTLPAPPPVIFTTAYSEYALESFELNVLDYLLKPVSFPRFLKAALKARDFLEVRSHPQATAGDYFFIKCNGRLEKINIADVRYIEGMANYVIIHTAEKKYVTYLTFKGVEEHLRAAQFIRIHKSYLVSIAAIKSIDGNDVRLEHITLPMSKNYRAEVLAGIEARMLRR